jgi:hypothetical protein
LKPAADEEERPDYVWKQSSEEVTVWYRIPLSARKADFNIKITASSISCTFNGRLVLEGELQHNIKHDESFWQISSSRCIESFQDFPFMLKAFII